jgi:hypothetical protein
MDCDLKFKVLTLQDIIEMSEYFKQCKLHLSDYSAAFKFMWQKHFTMDFAYVGKCVVFKEEYKSATYFHYPMSLNDNDQEAEEAIDILEQYCKYNNIRIHFTCVPKCKMMPLIERYGMELRITNQRKWKDYFYNAQDFVTYGGGKFSGQRNHVNKFKKLYPDYKFVQLTTDDTEQITEFLKHYESRQLAKGTAIAKEELEGVYDLLPYLKQLNQFAGGLVIDGKLSAISIGEKCGDQLIVHVEKALTQFEGIYPTMAQEFAKHFVTEEIKYINREDDAGDKGLRKSKLQYNPIRLIDKYDLFPRRVIDRIANIPTLHSERLLLKEVEDMDALALYELEMDEERCKLWGYNWRDYTDKTPTPEYFMNSLREDFKNKEEMPMGIYLGREMIGEVVLHNFGYRNDCEIGMRLLPRYEGFGYAKEAMLALMSYAFYDLNMELITAKCHKINDKSRKTLISTGLRPNGEDDTFFYFYKTAAM